MSRCLFPDEVGQGVVTNKLAISGSWFPFFISFFFTSCWGWCNKIDKIIRVARVSSVEMDHCGGGVLNILKRRVLEFVQLELRGDCAGGAAEVFS